MFWVTLTSAALVLDDDSGGSGLAVVVCDGNDGYGGVDVLQW